MPSKPQKWTQIAEDQTPTTDVEHLLDGVVEKVMDRLGMSELTPALATSLEDKLATSIDVSRLTSALWELHGDALQSKLEQMLLAKLR